MTEDETAALQTGQRSFRGGSFQGADFSGTDLRGADFTGADLRSANFRDARFGVQPRVGTAFLVGAMLIAIGAGIVIGWAVEKMQDRLFSQPWDEAAEGGSVILVLVVLLGMIIWRGFDVAIRVAAITYVVLVVVNVIANLLWEEFEWHSVGRATALVAVVVLAVMAGILGRVVGGVFGSWSIALVSVMGGLASGRANGGVAGVIVAALLIFISKRAMRGDSRDQSLRRLAHRLVRRWGTTFVDADLTGADFTGVDTSRCEVKGATLVNVIWDHEMPRPLDMTDEANLT